MWCWPWKKGGLICCKFWRFLDGVAPSTAASPHIPEVFVYSSAEYASLIAFTNERALHIPSKFTNYELLFINQQIESYENHFSLAMRHEISTQDVRLKDLSSISSHIRISRKISPWRCELLWCIVSDSGRLGGERCSKCSNVWLVDRFNPEGHPALQVRMKENATLHTATFGTSALATQRSVRRPLIPAVLQQVPADAPSQTASVL